MLLHEFLEASVSQRPNKVALVCDDRSYTYAQLGDMVASLAAGAAAPRRASG